MLELADTLGTEQAFSIQGISYLKDGDIRRTPSRGFIDDIDDLVPAPDLLDMGAYRHLEMGKRKMTSILTSRGCPFGCSFSLLHRVQRQEVEIAQPRENC